MPPRVLAILGPTASGKSALAHELARRLDGVVLAVDSMTVYRGMDIGTAKASHAERTEVTYEGLDLVEPTESFTVAQWLSEAKNVIAGERPVIACGGTPLYYQSLFRGLFDGPPADEMFRVEHREVPEDELRRRVAEIDPESAQRIARNDTRRLIRALEVHHLTGVPLTQHQQQWEQGPDVVDSVRFGLAWDRPTLNRRINARTKLMMEAGWLDEVQALLERHGELSPTARDAAGYRFLTQVVRGRMKITDATEQIKIKTRQLAKRQMSWFRRFERTTWLPGEAELEANVEQVTSAWSGGARSSEETKIREGAADA